MPNGDPSASILTVDLRSSITSPYCHHHHHDRAASRRLRAPLPHLHAIANLTDELSAFNNDSFVVSASLSTTPELSLSPPHTTTALRTRNPASSSLSPLSSTASPSPVSSTPGQLNHDRRAVRVGPAPNVDSDAGADRGIDVGEEDAEVDAAREGYRVEVERERASAHTIEGLNVKAVREAWTSTTKAEDGWISKMQRVDGAW